MITVVLHYKNRLEEQLWAQVIRTFPPDKLYMFHTNLIPQQRELLNVKTGVPKHGELVLLAPLTSKYFKATKNLNTFEHPEDAVYVCGPNNEHLTITHLGNRYPDHVVYYDTDNGAELYNYHAYMLAAYHRQLNET